MAGVEGRKCPQCGGEKYHIRESVETDQSLDGRLVEVEYVHFACVACSGKEKDFGYSIEIGRRTKGRWWRRGLYMPKPLPGPEVKPMEDFTKKDLHGQAKGARGLGPNDGKDLTIDHETGKIFVPGVGELDLVGPTSGQDYKRLQAAEAQWQKDKAMVSKLMAAMWVCQQCRKVQHGTGVRIKLKTISGVRVTVFVCSDRKCDGPVVLKDGATGQGLIITPDKGTGILQQ